MDQDPVDSTAFRRGGSTAGYLYFGVVAHACVFVLWVRDYLDVGWSEGIPQNIKLAVRGPAGMLAYLGTAGWLAISVCMVIFATRRGWAGKRWDVLLLALPGIVVTAGIVLLLMATRASTLLMHQEKALFGGTAHGGGLLSFVLLGPPVAAAFALGALQLSLLSVCASARAITVSGKRIDGRHGLLGVFGLAVFAGCVAGGDPGLNQPVVVLASLLAVVMVWLSGRSRSAMLPASRVALLGSSAVALGAAVHQLWHVPQTDDLSYMASYYAKVAHQAGALLWLCVPPIALLLVLWLIHAGSSPDGAQEQSTSSAALGSWRSLTTGGVLLVSGGIGLVAFTAQRFAFHRTIHAMIAAHVPDIPVDVELPVLGARPISSPEPGPAIAVGRKHVGFIGGRQHDATRFDGPHCPSLTAPSPALAGATAPLLELDVSTSAPRLCCVSRALSGAGFSAVQILVGSSMHFKQLPSPFDDYHPPMRAIPVRLVSAKVAAAADNRLVLGHDSLLFMNARGCKRYPMSPATLTGLHNEAMGEFLMNSGQGRLVVSMSTGASAAELVRALAGLVPRYAFALDTTCITPSQLSDLASAKYCSAP